MCCAVSVYWQGMVTVDRWEWTFETCRYFAGSLSMCIGLMTCDILLYSNFYFRWIASSLLIFFRQYLKKFLHLLFSYFVTLFLFLLYNISLVVALFYGLQFNIYVFIKILKNASPHL